MCKGERIKEPSLRKRRDQALRDAVQQHPDYTVHQIAQELGRPLDGVKIALERLHLMVKELPSKTELMAADIKKLIAENPKILQGELAKKLGVHQSRVSYIMVTYGIEGYRTTGTRRSRPSDTEMFDLAQIYSSPAWNDARQSLYVKYLGFFSKMKTGTTPPLSNVTPNTSSQDCVEVCLARWLWLTDSKFQAILKASKPHLFKTRRSEMTDDQAWKLAVGAGSMVEARAAIGKAVWDRFEQKGKLKELAAHYDSLRSQNRQAKINESKTQFFMLAATAPHPTTIRKQNSKLYGQALDLGWITEACSLGLFPQYMHRELDITKVLQTLQQKSGVVEARNKASKELKFLLDKHPEKYPELKEHWKRKR